MANVKISELPAASTPLTGAEIVPIVKSGVTDKVAVSDLTAGRAVSASDVTVTNLTASQAVLTDADKKLVSQATTGTGNVVRATGPTMTLANATGLPLTTGVTGTLPVANGGTGITSLGSGVATWLGSPSSANLAAAVTDETGSGALVFATSPSISGPSISSGNLLFSSTGQRITGDMSNATIASRVLAQTSTVNGASNYGLIPNGTGNVTAFDVFNSSDPANASRGQFQATSTAIRILSNATGTGTTLPFSIFVSGAEQARFGGSSSVQSIGSFATGVPVTINAATYTVATTDYAVRFTTTNCTVTLPSAATFTGRILMLSTVTANSVTSASSNVVPLGSSVAGTAILAATAGKFATLQSDGSLWYVLTAN